MLELRTLEAVTKALKVRTCMASKAVAEAVVKKRPKDSAFDFCDSASIFCRDEIFLEEVFEA